jgi:hypothetical protein
MPKTPELWIWVNRWPEFQHYKPDPERGPAWIKTHTAQLSDDRYLKLTDRQRALLHDLRMLFATFRGRLAYDRAMIARQRNLQTRDEDLNTLIQAGLLVILSRASLDHALEQFYSNSRAEKKKRREELDIEPNPPQPVQIHVAPDPEPEAEEPDELLQAVLAGGSLTKDIPW